MSFSVRSICIGLALALASPSAVFGTPAAAPGLPAAQFDLPLTDGRVATVYPSGLTILRDAKRGSIEYRMLPPLQVALSATADDRKQLAYDLAKAPAQAYEPSRVIVVFRSGRAPVSDAYAVPPEALTALRGAGATHAVPPYTVDSSTNSVLAALGVDSLERLFRGIDRGTLSRLSVTNGSPGRAALDIGNAYRVHLTGASVENAVRALEPLAGIAYVSPEWHVAALKTPAVTLSPEAIRDAGARAGRVISAVASAASQLPSNYALTASAQSMLNAPGVDAAAAYDEIEQQFHQLPGQGEIVTNVSIGDITDASEAHNPKDPCAANVIGSGATTALIGGQHYIDWPAMPLIPAFTADSNGKLNGSGTVCNADPSLGEVGLDFSVMAPLPHQLQRSGRQGSGYTDLLGIAPGAQYRLVVPADAAATIPDIQAALLGAAMQSPRPNVITASLGYGLDVTGFPSRYLEEDPLTEAIVASVVQNYGIVTCIAAGDGTRLFTNAAIGPSGGSAETNLAGAGGTPTSLADLAMSTAPSAIFDSGALDVGGTTLDDIFAVPPQYAPTQRAKFAQTYADTRETGSLNFSSGLGSRVNLSAPGDNILALAYRGPAPSDVSVGIAGGTSASSPEAAAASAVALQVARLTGRPFSGPRALRDFLAGNGTPVWAIPQGDPVHIGMQLSVKNAVEQLLANVGIKGQSAVPRIAVAQRRSIQNFSPFLQDDEVFVSDTDASNIDLLGTTDAVTGELSGRNAFSWITIAPDWERLPAGSTFALTIGSARKTLATTPNARLFPGEILAAAGLPLVSSQQRTVNLVYQARTPSGRVVARAFALTFGPANPTTELVLAPQVPALVTGTTIPVTYDLRIARHLDHPTLVVSEPGRFYDYAAGFRPAYSVALSALKGTVNVPVSALQGGGIYGIGIILNHSYLGLPFMFPTYSDFAFTRVAPQGAAARHASAPLLAANGSTPGHFLELPFDGGPVSISYDVTNVARATGAILEVSAPGGNQYQSTNLFNNPGGSLRDHNGTDTGSVYFAQLPGAKGTISITPSALGLRPGMYHNVRVLPAAGQTPIDQAGDVSTLIEDAIGAPDGGYTGFGFGINQHGTDAFLTSQTLPSGSIYTFDQRSPAAKTLVATESQGFYDGIGGFNLFGDDAAIVRSLPYTGPTTYHMFTPSTNALGGKWDFPYPSATFDTLSSALNQDDTAGVFLGVDATMPVEHVFFYRADVARNTFGPAVYLKTVFPQDSFSNASTLIAENTRTKLALTAELVPKKPHSTMITLDSNDELGTFASLGLGAVTGIAIDSTTNKAAILTDGDAGLTIYDLATKSGHEVLLPQAAACGPVCEGLYIVADQRKHEFLVQQTVPLTGLVDNNAISNVLVYNENGGLLKTIAGFSLWNTTLFYNWSYLQVNPMTGKGYIETDFTRQIATFDY